MRQFVVFLLLSGPCVVAAQTTSPPVPSPPENSPALTIQITVNLVQVDAVVTDSKNHPVTNLQAKDFEILQDGVPQVITNLSYIREAAPDTGLWHPAEPVVGFGCFDRCACQQSNTSIRCKGKCGGPYLQARSEDRLCL